MIAIFGTGPLAVRSTAEFLKGLDNRSRRLPEQIAKCPCRTACGLLALAVEKRSAVWHGVLAERPWMRPTRW